MNSGVDIADIKLHSRVSSDDEDTLLASYIRAAEAHVVNHIRVDLDEDHYGDWPEPAKQAIRLLVGHWFVHREAVATAGAGSVLPIGVSDILAPLRNLS